MGLVVSTPRNTDEKLREKVVQTSGQEPRDSHDDTAEINDEPPHPPTELQSAATKADESELPQELRDRLGALLKNERSFLSLNQCNEQNLLKLDVSELRKVVFADERFIKQCDACWNLPVELRAQTRENAKDNYNEDLCRTLKLAQISNRAPTSAFLAGWNALERAIDNGFDIYDQHSGQPAETALRSFGIAAQTINLAADPVSTQLSGRADTKFVQFEDPTGMTFKNDAVARSHAK